MGVLRVLIMSLLLVATGCVASGPPAAEPEVAAAPLSDPPPEAADSADMPADTAPTLIPDLQPEPPALAQQRAVCLRGGGQLTPRGNGVFACVTATRDAGQRCDEASDCEGVCLARSGTCAPLRPLFGCQEVFTLRGRRETLCVD